MPNTSAPVDYGDGVDPAQIETQIAKSEALRAEAEAVAAELNVLKANASLSGVPEDQQAALAAQLTQLTDTAATARRKADRLATLTTITDDERNIEHRGQAETAASTTGRQLASLVAQKSYTEKLLALTGENALTGEDLDDAQNKVKSLDAAIAQTTPVLAALQAERDKYPSLPEGVREALRNGPQGRGPNGRGGPRGQRTA